MEISRIASASSSVKLWDIEPTRNKDGQINYSSGNSIKFASSKQGVIRSIRWNHDASVLGVAKEDVVSIYNSKGQCVEKVSLPEDGQYIAKSIRFASKSKYLIIGGSEGLLRAWDRKGKRYVSSFKGHRATVNSIAVNIDDTLLASGSINGELLLHRRQKPSESIVAKGTSGRKINAVEFSPFKRSMLVTAEDDGIVRLWDTENPTETLTIFQPAHSGPVVDIAFSQFNRFLLCSIGSDRNILLYDVNQDNKKKIVKTITTNDEFTALSFKNDGVTIATGTSKGRIVFYDLRSYKQAVFSHDAHDSEPVRCLQFQQTRYPGYKKATKPTESTKSSKHDENDEKASRPNAPEPERTKITDPPPPTATLSTPPPSFPETSNYLDVFSPLHRGAGDGKGTIEPSMVAPGGISGMEFSIVQDFVSKSFVASRKETLANSPEHYQNKPSPALKSHELTPTIPNSHTNEDSAPSLSSSSSTSKTYASLNPSPRPSTMASGGPLAPEDGKDELDVRLQQLTENLKGNIMQGIVQGVSASNELPKKSSGKRVAFAEVDEVAPPAAEEVGSEEAKLESRGPEGLEGMERSPLRQDPSPTASRPSLTGASLETSGSTSAASSFQLGVVQNVIKDCLEEFREALRNDIHNMHVELLRQFYMQKMEFEMMFQRYCNTAPLREEIERLREENRRLKAQQPFL
ncbi:uncharacterized protein VTP21DRAFT_10697 [Calcarisporiella thermophila]|uniref:uncharacterized protein n=1 Tax=Calcarisporiella thermophila TaxID=911321 RepID=UPI0037424793